MGLSDAAVDINDAKVAHAKVMGADLTFNAKTSDPVAELKFRLTELLQPQAAL